MNRLLELQQKIADSAARSDIECFGVAAEPEKLGPWYIAKSTDPEMQEALDMAVEYLTLRGLIAPHPKNVGWVTVNIAQPVRFA